MPSASSPAAMNERGPFIPPISSGIRSCTGRAAVNSPLYSKKSPLKSILPSSRNVRMTYSASFRRESGLRAAQSTPYCAIRPKLPVADDGLDAAVGQLVERRERLHDQRRLAQEHVGHVRAEADPLRLVRRGREQHRPVLVPRLVDAVDRVEAQLVRDLDRLDRVLQRIVGQHAVAEAHRAVPLTHPAAPLRIRRRWPSGGASTRGGRGGSRRSAACPSSGTSCCAHVLGHERGIDLEDVLEAHDRDVAHALRLGRDDVLLAPVRAHFRSSSNTPSSPYLPGFITLLGSSARLSVRMTS